jgi:hypothetical protein
MTIEVHNILTDKAKTRKDGVYAYRGLMYAVKNNRFIAYADYSGNISTLYGVFHRSCGRVQIWERKKELMKFIVV